MRLPQAGSCPCYQVGDTFLFERYGSADDFWHVGLNTLRQTAEPAESTAGGPVFPHCSEAWDAISRYIYAGLQGGSIMRGWMWDEREMIACCSGGTRPVIFRIERIDCKVLHLSVPGTEVCRKELLELEGVKEVLFKDSCAEVVLDADVEDQLLKAAAERAGDGAVLCVE